MRRGRLLALTSFALVTVLAGCGDDDGGSSEDAGERAAAVAALVESGEFTADGEDLYRRSCASCHGPDGQGGIGPQLAGVVAENLPVVDDHAAVVLGGRGQMPAFGPTLSDDEIAAIVAYERTELGEE